MRKQLTKKGHKIALALIFMLVLLNVRVYSQQPGSIDMTFGRPTNALGDSTRFNSTIHALIVQPDQKILAAGNFTSYNGTARSRIARLNSDGTYDTLGFFVASGFSSGVVFSLALQSDGKILAGGTFTSYNSQPRNGIVRINADGTLDTSFTVGTGFNTGSTVYVIAVQPDGKILVGGTFTTYDSHAGSRIIRLETNGAVDTTFNSGTGFNNDVNCIVFDSLNSKIIIGGNFTYYKGNPQNRIVMVDLNGTIDAGFLIGNGFNNRVNSIALSNGQIIAAGNFTQYNGNSKNRIIRLNTNGSFDNSFVSGTGFNNTVNKIIIDASGNIIAGGIFVTYDGVTQNRVCRLLTNGNIDVSFHSLEGADDGVNALAIQNDGRIVCGGLFDNYNDTYRSGICRLNVNGGLDNTLNLVFGFTGAYIVSSMNLNALAIQPDGKILAGGEFERYNGSLYYHLIRIDAFGNIDTSFHPGLTNSATSVNSIALDTINNKIYIGGNFSSYDGVSRNRIARLNWDGSLDLTFNTGTGFNSTVNEILIQSDNKIVVGGWFTSYDGIIRNQIARLESTGTLDLNFNVGTGFNSTVHCLAQQQSGKILVGGDFTSYNGISTGRLARLETNGGIDNTFITGSGFNFSVFDLVIQSDQKIIVCGSFNNFNSVVSNRIARLDSSGNLDASFTNGGFNITVYKLALQSNGNIIAGGSFTDFDGNACQNIVRINPNGSFDFSFVSGNGFNNSIRAIAVQSDGKILAGGGFTMYDNYFINRLIRLDGSGNGTGINQIESNIGLNVFPNPASDRLHIDLGEVPLKPVLLTLSNLSGEIIFSQLLTNQFSNLTLNYPAGIYMVTVVGSKKTVMKKIVVID